MTITNALTYLVRMKCLLSLKKDYLNVFNENNNWSDENLINYQHSSNILLISTKIFNDPFYSKIHDSLKYRNKMQDWILDYLIHKSSFPKQTQVVIL